MFGTTIRWFYHQSPVAAGMSASIVAGVDQGTHPIVTFLRALLIPLTVMAVKLIIENTYPRIKAAVVAWQTAREQRRLTTLDGRLESLQHQLNQALASGHVKDSTISILNSRLEEERTANREQYAELLRQIEASKVHLNNRLDRNLEAIQAGGGH